MIVVELDCMACHEHRYEYVSAPQNEYRCGRCGSVVEGREVGESVSRAEVVPLLPPGHTVVIINCSAQGGKAGVRTAAGATTYVVDSDFRGMPVAIDNTSGATIHVRGNRHLPDER